MTDAEKIAECYRLVSEHERKLAPYDRALFIQRLDRRLRARTRSEIQSRSVDGSCIILTSELWWKRKAIREATATANP